MFVCVHVCVRERKERERETEPWHPFGSKDITFQSQYPYHMDPGHTPGLQLASKYGRVENIFSKYTRKLKRSIKQQVMSRKSFLKVVKSLLFCTYTSLPWTECLLWSSEVLITLPVYQIKNDEALVHRAHGLVY